MCSNIVHFVLWIFQCDTGVRPAREIVSRFHGIALNVSIFDGRDGWFAPNSVIILPPTRKSRAPPRRPNIRSRNRSLTDDVILKKKKKRIKK